MSIVSSELEVTTERQLLNVQHFGWAKSLNIIILSIYIIFIIYLQFIIYIIYVKQNLFYLILLLNEKFFNGPRGRRFDAPRPPILHMAGLDAEATATTGNPNMPPLPDPLCSWDSGMTDRIPRAASRDITPTCLRSTTGIAMSGDGPPAPWYFCLCACSPASVGY